MQKSILICFSLAVASFSANAYEILSQKKINNSNNPANYTYSIQCNSGVTKTVYSKTIATDDVLARSKVYLIDGGVGGYVSVDQAAKKACNE
jgi:hypothetical protein